MGYDIFWVGTGMHPLMYLDFIHGWLSLQKSHVWVHWCLAHPFRKGLCSAPGEDCHTRHGGWQCKWVDLVKVTSGLEMFWLIDIKLDYESLHHFFEMETSFFGNKEWTFMGVFVVIFWLVWSVCNTPSRFPWTTCDVFSNKFCIKWCLLASLGAAKVDFKPLDLDLGSMHPSGSP